MKYLILLLFSISISILFSQEIQAMDSSSYKFGKKIGENIPVAVLMIFAVFFIFRSYRRRNEEKPKTDFMDDGTIEK